MSTEQSLLRSWQAELAGIETYIRISLYGSLSPAAVRRVEADAVAIADDLLTRSGFDPDDLAFAGGIWQPPALVAEARAPEEHTDELLTAMVASATTPAETPAVPEAVAAASREPFAEEGEPSNPWVTYDEVPTQSSPDDFAEAEGEWAQFDDEQPTHSGASSGPPLAQLGPASATPDLTPTFRSEAASDAGKPPPSYLIEEDERDAFVSEDEDEDELQDEDQVTGVFLRGSPTASAVPAALRTGEPAKPAPPPKPTADEAATPVPARTRTPTPSRAPAVQAAEPTRRSAEVQEFELMDDIELGGPLTEDDDDEASDGEVVQKRRASVAIATSRGPKAAVKAPSPEVPATRAASVRASVPAVPRGSTAGLYGGASVPTIRDSGDPRPKAAAIQINAATGSSKVIGLEEEEEPLEIGSAEDYGEDEPSGDTNLEGGFRVNLQEYEEGDPAEEELLEAAEDEDEDEEEPEPTVPIRTPAPVATGPTAAQINEMLLQARTAEEGGQLDDGIALYADVIDADAENIDARVGRGRLYLDRGDFARAMSDFMVAEEIGPKHPEPQIAIGDLHFARKDYRKAIEYFDLALSLAPKSAKAYCRRGISHYWRKAYPQALTDLTTAQKLDPETANIGTYITMVRKKMKK